MAVHVVANRARERAKTTTVYICRIENLPLWSDNVTSVTPIER